jgi:hypothetical protein
MWPNDKGRTRRCALFVAPQSLIETATGAGEGIRTLDPDLGKVVLYP